MNKQTRDRAHTVILDFDGTLVPNDWPNRPRTFMPGAIEAVFALHRAGMHQTVQTARMNPYDPWTGRLLDPAKPATEKTYIRQLLDGQGLTFVDIWDKPGKASGSAYVDDKAYRYSGTAGAWKALANTLIMRLTAEEPPFPSMPKSDDLTPPFIYRKEQPEWG